MRGLRQAERRLKAFGAKVRAMGLAVAAAGAAIVAPMVGAAKVFSGFGDQVAKMSKRTGLSVEALSELRFVASQTGTEFGALELAFRKMQRSIYDAGRGLSTQVDALADIGLAYEDLKNLSPEEQFMKLGKHIGAVEDPTRRAAIAMSLFGRTGTNLLPMFAEGADGIANLRDEARRLGLTMSTEDAVAAEVFTDLMDKLGKSLKMVVFHIGAALAPLLGEVAENLADVSTRLGKWVQANRGIIVSVFKIGTALAVGGAAIAAFGVTFSGLGMAIGVVTKVLAVAHASFMALGPILASLASPIGLVVGGAVTLGAALWYAYASGGDALEKLGKRFSTLKGDATKAFSGISDALTAGDIGLAAQVLWQSLKLLWARGTNALQKVWLDFSSTMIRLGGDLWHGMLATAAEAWHLLEVGWIETAAFFSDAWAGLANAFAHVWEDIKGIAKKGWIAIKGLFDDSTAESRRAAYKKVDDEKQATLTRIDAQTGKAVLDREAERKAKRERSKSDLDATLAEIGKGNLKQHDALDAEYNTKLARIEADLAAAIKARDDALQAAKNARANAETSGNRPRTPEGPGQFVPPDDPAPILAKVAAKIGASGTFSGSMLGLQAGGASDRLTKLTEDTVGLTEKIERNTRPLRNSGGAGAVFV